MVASKAPAVARTNSIHTHATQRSPAQAASRPRLDVADDQLLQGFMSVLSLNTNPDPPNLVTLHVAHELRHGAIAAHPELCLQCQ